MEHLQRFSPYNGRCSDFKSGSSYGLKGAFIEHRAETKKLVASLSVKTLIGPFGKPLYRFSRKHATSNSTESDGFHRVFIGAFAEHFPRRPGKSENRFKKKKNMLKINNVLKFGLEACK